MPVITATQAGGANRCAFLDMIKTSEIGAALIAITDAGYNVLVGATPSNPLTFPSYADHPNIFNAALDSTAAGAYQLLHRWWADTVRADGSINHGYKTMLNLPDFSKLSQDKVALQQIKERGALADIDAGNFANAVAACSGTWASLPGNDYGQHTNALAALQAAYVAAGGTLSA